MMDKLFGYKSTVRGTTVGRCEVPKQVTLQESEVWPSSSFKVLCFSLVLNGILINCDLLSLFTCE